MCGRLRAGEILLPMGMDDAEVLAHVTQTAKNRLAEIRRLRAELERLRAERDEARAWARGFEHGLFTVDTDHPPAWLTAPLDLHGD